jgi:hypothetical protein
MSNYVVTGEQLTAIANAIRQRDIREDIRDSNGYAEIDTSKDYLYSCILPTVYSDQPYNFTIKYYDSSKTQISSTQFMVYELSTISYDRVYSSLKPYNGYPSGVKYVKVTPPNGTVAENICEMVSYEFPTGFVNGIRGN